MRNVRNPDSFAMRIASSASRNAHVDPRVIVCSSAPSKRNAKRKRDDG